MNYIEEIKNVNVKDQMKTFNHIFTSFFESYQRKTSWKIKLIDSFIVYCILLFIIQLVYVLLVGKWPMNSLISGLVCALGIITLTGKLFNIIIISFCFYFNQFLCI